jgi:hypothetical protein
MWWNRLQELEAMRQQAQIWSDVSSSEVEKMHAEGELLTGQLAARSAELAELRQQLTDVEAERDRALQERQQVGAGMNGDRPLAAVRSYGKRCSIKQWPADSLQLSGS